MNDTESENRSRQSRGFNDLLVFLIRNRSIDGLRSWEVEDLKGEVYEEIRRKLIRLFRWRGAEDPEGLVDKTFDRVSQRLPDLTSFVGEPSHYVCGIARLVFLESLRRRRVPDPEPQVENEERKEAALDCLDHCLEQLRPVERELILEYYRGEKRAKIDHREAVAQRLGTSLNALRIQTCRIRNRLRKCATACLKQKYNAHFSH